MMPSNLGDYLILMLHYCSPKLFAKTESYLATGLMLLLAITSF